MKKYISPSSWFSFEYPDTWNEFEDEEGTFLFYNPDLWNGSLRVSASLDISPDFANKIMREELQQYANASFVKIGRWDCVYSQESFKENELDYITHFFVTGKGNMVLFFSFTQSVGERIDVVHKIIESVLFLNPERPSCHEVIPLRLMEIMVVNEAYQWGVKKVKELLKKDIASIPVDKSLACLQELLDKGKIADNMENRKRLSLILCCFLLGEVDGVEWVSLIDGSLEIPILFWGHRADYPATFLLKDADEYLLRPYEFVTQQMTEGRTLMYIYNLMLNYHTLK